jgi:hypothetical protein
MTHLPPVYLSAIDPAVAVVGVSSTDGTVVRCTGVFVHTAWILTAAHCIEMSGQRTGVIVYHGAGDREVWQALVKQAIAHPTWDVALLGTGTEGASALTLPLEDDDGQTIVNTIGYSPVHEWRINGTKSMPWASEMIVAVGAATLTTNVLSESGPCVGDSGGPLIIDGPSGGPAVAGILSRGSLSCRGLDEYVPTDRLFDWIRETVAKAPSDDIQWGGPSPQLRCRAGSVRACEKAGEKLRPCEQAGMLCEYGHVASVQCLPGNASEWSATNTVLCPTPIGEE